MAYPNNVWDLAKLFRHFDLGSPHIKINNCFMESVIN